MEVIVLLVKIWKFVMIVSYHTKYQAITIKKSIQISFVFHRRRGVVKGHHACVCGVSGLEMGRVTSYLGIPLARLTHIYLGPWMAHGLKLYAHILADWVQIGLFAPKLVHTSGWAYLCLNWISHLCPNQVNLHAHNVHSCPNWIIPFMSKIGGPIHV